MANSLSLVSVIIPCRNEERFIGKCLDSIIFQDYPKEKLEVLVVDGSSEDKTKEIIKSYLQKYYFLKLLENSKKFTPFGLNIGIKEAKGDLIMRMDTHASYEKDYVSKCVRYLKEYNADNVGGAIKTLPAKNNLIAKAIAFCLSSPFGASSSFRLGAKEIKEADTVFGGCYKKEVFKKIGFFNENLKRSQDLEFNLRLKKAGGKILLAPDIVSYYYPSSSIRDFSKHNFSDGIWVIYPLKFGVKAFSLRHLIPSFFVLGLIITFLLSFVAKILFLLFLLIAAFYLILAVFFSLQISFREKDNRYLFLMPLAFISRHFAYGLGSFWGFLKLMIG